MLFVGNELGKAMLKVAIGTAIGVKYGIDIASRIGADARAIKEYERLQKKMLVDEFSKLERPARKGNVDAQFEYGLQLCIYGNQNDSNVDINEGLKWIEKAANNGHTNAVQFINNFVSAD